MLEDHGWIIHRIWSTDWFQRPQEQLERTVAAVAAAKRELDARMEGASSHGRAVPIKIVTVERGDVTQIGLVPEVAAEDGATGLYVEAIAEAPTDGRELHEVPPELLAPVIERIVAVEGPVHVDEVTARLKVAWGIQRAGARIQANVERSVALSVGTKRLVLEGSFLSVPDVKVRVRDRSLTTSPTLRRAEMLPPAEICTAALAIVRSNFGAAPEEVVQGAARAFGFKSIGSQLREAVRTQLDAMVEAGDLLRKGDVLVLPETALRKAQDIAAGTLH